MKVPIFLFTWVFLFFIYFPFQASAQEIATGFAHSVLIQGSNVRNGDIVSFTKGNYLLPTTQFDSNIYGVVNEQSALSIESTKIPNTYPVISSGQALVLVDDQKGAIQKGDAITSSTHQGIGEKALSSGFILGTALESYNGANPGLILVDINPHSYTGGKNTLLSSVGSLTIPAFLSFLAAFRYIIAVIVATAAFFLSFYYFGKISKAGVEAVGRNPLAATDIRLSIFFHIALTLGILAIGLVLSYFILVL